VEVTTFILHVGAFILHVSEQDVLATVYVYKVDESEKHLYEQLEFG